MDVVSDGGSDKKQSRRPFIAFAVIVLLAIVENELSQFRLVSEEPYWVSLCGGLFGFLIGGLLSDRVYRFRRNRGNKISFGQGLTLLFFQILMIFGGTNAAERVFLRLAFVGGAAVSVKTAEAAIADKFRRRSMIRLQIDPHLSRIAVPVDSRPQPSAIGRFCIALPLERGKYGALRTRVPTLWDDPIRLDQFRPCSPQLLRKNPDLAERVARIDARERDQARDR